MTVEFPPVTLFLYVYSRLISVKLEFLRSGPVLISKVVKYNELIMWKVIIVIINYNSINKVIIVK